VGGLLLFGFFFFSSPTKNSAIQMKSEGCPPQPGKRAFPTKESFNADTTARPPSSSSGNWFAQTGSSKEGKRVYNMQYF